MGAPSVEAEVLTGSTTPRLWTAPLVEGPAGPCGCGCALSPVTSYGFDVAVFAESVLRAPLDPWQRWLVIHAGELLPDGRPRFRKVLAIVARQCGKTHLLMVLTLFWLFVERQPMILGTSTKLDTARESWQKAVGLALRLPELSAMLPPTRNRGVRQTNGEQELAVLADPLFAGETCRYKIAPANAEGGRGLSVDRAILDELRQHHDYSAWDAIVPTTNARRGSQVWAISNQGDDRSVVLNDLRDGALHFVRSGEGDRRTGLFEWSAPDGADPEDVAALLQAVPAVGYRQELDGLLEDGRSAKRTGGKKLAGFRTEIMCQRVKNLDPAIDPQAWLECLDLGDLSGVRSRVALCVDVSVDVQHATLCAAAVLPDGRVRVEPVAAWSGPGCTVELAAELPRQVARVKPRVIGWFPSGPAASVAVDLRKRSGWPPRGVRLEEIRADSAAVCMGFEAAVVARRVAHAADPLLDAHVAVAEPLRSGDRWVFGRRGSGHVDALYAAAGAAHLARGLPVAVRRSRVITAGGEPRKVDESGSVAE